MAITQWSKPGLQNHVMIHRICTHGPLRECRGLQTNQLRVLDGPAKCLLLRRARLKRQAHYIVVVRIAPDQNGPEQNGLEQMLWPPASTHGSSSCNLGPNDSLAQHRGASTPTRHAEQARMQEPNDSSAQLGGACTANPTVTTGPQLTSIPIKRV